MNEAEAAHRLGVAEAEVVDIKAQAGWWHALHHDMASHVERWRPVPLTADEAAAMSPEDLTTKLLTDGELLIDLGPAQTPAPSPEAEGSSGDGAGQDDDPDGPGVDTDGDGVPEGSARQILDWVRDDRDRAAQALAAEERRESPRVTLVAALEKAIG